MQLKDNIDLDIEDKSLVYFIQKQLKNLDEECKSTNNVVVQSAKEKYKNDSVFSIKGSNTGFNFFILLNTICDNTNSHSVIAFMSDKPDVLSSKSAQISYTIENNNLKKFDIINKHDLTLNETLKEQLVSMYHTHLKENKLL